MAFEACPRAFDHMQRPPIRIHWRLLGVKHHQAMKMLSEHGIANVLS